MRTSNVIAVILLNFTNPNKFTNRNRFFLDRNTSVRISEGVLYYGVSIDSTPEVSHTDQLTVILRYVLSDGIVVERFVQLIPIDRHDGKYLFDVLIKFLQQSGIDLYCADHNLMTIRAT